MKNQKQNQKPNKSAVSREQRRKQWQSIAIVAVSVILILSWILSLAVNM